MKSSRMPSDSEWLFPEYDYGSLELERHSGIIIERMLERGTWEQLGWLFDAFGEDRVTEWVRRHGFRLLSQRSFALWCLALGINDYVAPEWAREARRMDPW